MKKFIITTAILLYILKKQFKMGNNLKKINDALSSIGDSVANVAADINKLVSAQEDGLSSEQASDVASKLESVAANIKAVADVVPDEVTAEIPEETPVETPTEETPEEETPEEGEVFP